MKTNIQTMIIIFLSVFFLSSCSLNSTPPLPTPTPTPTPKLTDVCQPGFISLPGYTDHGKRLPNCFIEFPGEPTRQDNNYYIIEDICVQFTSQFIAKNLGQIIIKTSGPSTTDSYSCSYYTNSTDYMKLTLNYHSLPDLNKDPVSGKFTASDQLITMKHLVVYQANGEVDTIYLALGDKKTIAINHQGNFSNSVLMKFASNLAWQIQDYH